MRICIRCGTEMKEDCALKIEGGLNELQICKDADAWFGGRIGRPKVAICPRCGEISIYADAEQLQEL